MTRRRLDARTGRALGAAALSAALVIGAGPSRAAPTPPGDPDFSELVAAAEKTVAELSLPGAALWVGNPAGAWLERYVGAYDEDTAAPLAGVGRWMAAATIMALVDDGKLSLDAPIGEHLPALTGRKAQITLRQLLSQTAGVPARLTLPEGTRRVQVDLGAAVDRFVAETALVSEPGAQARSSNLSIDIAARVAELATGKEWNELFAERIGAPLGLSKARYGRRRKGPVQSVAGGGRATLRDVATFVTMLLNGGVHEGQRVLSLDAIAAIERLPVGMTPTAGRGPRQAHGLGVTILRTDGLGQGRELTSGPGPSVAWIDRERGIGGVLLIQARTRKDRNRVRQIKPRASATEAFDRARPGAKPADEPGGEDDGDEPEEGGGDGG